MAVRSRDEIIELARTILAERTDDDALSFMEDIADTVDEYENRNSDSWKTRYEENDANWRKRYRDRFLGKIEDDEGEVIDKKADGAEVEIKTSFEDLFTESEV